MASTLLKSSQALLAGQKACPVGIRRALPYTSPQLRTCKPAVQRSARLVGRAAGGDDLDAYLIKVAEKWEKADKKPIVVAYVAGALFAFFTAEWLIHLPGLNVLLGVPVQALGLLLLPYLGIRWFADGVKAGSDVEAYTAKIVEKLPGLK